MLMPVAAQGFGELPARFTLGKAIPANAWMLVHGVHNPERAWIDAQWAEVFKELEKSGIGKDILNLIFSNMQGEDRAQAEQITAQMLKLIEAVKWGDMLHEEMVFAQTLTPPFPSYYLLGRGKAGSGEANFTALSAIFDYLVQFNPEFKVEPREEFGAAIRSVQIGPYRIEWFRRGDVIGFGAGTTPANDVLSLLAAEGTAGSILDTPQFKKALAEVKSPENELTYFDFRTLMTNVNGMIAMGMANAPPSEDDKQAVAIVNKIMGMVDVMEYVIATTETEGQRDLAHTAARFQADKMNTPLVKMTMNRKPFEKFDQYIPADTVSFTASGAIDVPLLYQTIMDFLANDIPDGAEAVRELRAGLAQINFDPQADLFAWWGGEMISITMPPAVVTMPGAKDSVSMVRVTNPELARQKVDALMAWGKTMLEQAQQQPFALSPADVGAEGFQKIFHPFLAMVQASPVIGFHGEWLIVGTSEAAVRKCIEVSKGNAPSIRENARFKAEGLMPKGPVAAISFTDTTNFGPELAAGVGTMSMMFGMMTAMMPPEPGVNEAKAMIQKVLGIATKLVPVFQKMNFFSSEAMVMTNEGSLSRTEMVVTYKPQQAEAPKAEAPKAESGTK
jgi:hypothetical protein